MSKVTISFQDASYPSFEVAEGEPLCEALDRPDSPVFFGCKTGNCGTCLIEIDAEAFAQFGPPNDTEKEMLDSLAADKPLARLACQLDAIANLTVRYLN